MIKVEIPGRETLMIEHVVLDYNGTVAVDGILLEELKPRLQALLKEVSVTVLTADTYGTVRAQCEPLGLRVETFPREGAAKCKAEIVKNLSGGKACFGNGFNDCDMFDLADLSACRTYIILRRHNEPAVARLSVSAALAPDFLIVAPVLPVVSLGVEVVRVGVL